MKTKRLAFVPLAIMASLAFASTASAAVTYNTIGAVSYSYSASGGPSTPLPPGSDATLSNITVAQYTLFAGGDPNVTGLTNVGGTIGTVNFHFQTGAGLSFSNDINLAVGNGRNASGSVVGEYSYDNLSWTPWFTNTTVDKNESATNVAAGQTDLYVRFTLNGNTTGDTVLTWGGTPNERPFTLTVTVVPEPSSLALLGIGGLALLRRRLR